MGCAGISLLPETARVMQPFPKTARVTQPSHFCNFCRPKPAIPRPFPAQRQGTALGWLQACICPLVLTPLLLLVASNPFVTVMFLVLQVNFLCNLQQRPWVSFFFLRLCTSLPWAYTAACLFVLMACSNTAVVFFMVWCPALVVQ